MEKAKSGSRLSKTSPLSKPLARPKIGKKKTTSGGGGIQAKLNAVGTKKMQDENKSSENSVAAPKHKTGFQVWFAENMSDLAEEHPDLSEADLLVAGAKSFKELSKEEKQKYNDQAKESDSEGSKKRKGSLVR